MPQVSCLIVFRNFKIYHGLGIDAIQEEPWVCLSCWGAQPMLPVPSASVPRYRSFRQGPKVDFYHSARSRGRLSRVLWETDVYPRFRFNPWNPPTLKLLSYSIIIWKKGCYMYEDPALYVHCLFSDLIEEKKCFYLTGPINKWKEMRCWPSNFIVFKVVGHN